MGQFAVNLRWGDRPHPARSLAAQKPAPQGVDTAPIAANARQRDPLASSRESTLPFHHSALYYFPLPIAFPSIVDDIVSTASLSTASEMWAYRAVVLGFR